MTKDPTTPILRAVANVLKEERATTAAALEALSSRITGLEAGTGAAAHASASASILRAQASALTAWADAPLHKRPERSGPPRPVLDFVEPSQ